MYEQTLAELEQTLPAGHPDIGAARSSLARAYRAAEVEKWGKLVRAIGVKAE